MAEHRFDELSKLFGARASRRGILKAALGLAAGGVLSRFGRGDAAASGREPAVAPASEAFQRTWARTDLPVAEGTVARTWMWGPEAFTEALSEPYAEAPGGNRTVQYFDKARMEDNAFRADGPPWDVTNGLLVVELITGSLQLGDSQFEDRQPAQINVAGDANDPDGPTYASFGAVLDAAPAQVGTAVTQRISRAGTVSDDPGLAGLGVTVAIVDDVTNHSIATPFWEFMNSSGVVYQDGQFVTDQLFDSPYFATGRPISEPYWADVQVGGTQRIVLVQCFERRCLTYTPGNPDGFVVEAGNVGQHYYEWRRSAPEEVSIVAAPPEVETQLENAADANAHYQILTDYLTGEGFAQVEQSATQASGGGLTPTEFLQTVFENAPPNPLRAFLTYDPVSSSDAIVYATVLTAQDDLLYLLYVDPDNVVRALFPFSDQGGTTSTSRSLVGGNDCNQCVNTCLAQPDLTAEIADASNRSCSDVAELLCKPLFADPSSIDDDDLASTFGTLWCALHVMDACLDRAVISECRARCAYQCSRNCELCSGEDPAAYCCPDGCRNLNNDENNCGSCGQTCAPNQSCCGGTCIDTLSDAANCGDCGVSCPDGQDCINGICTPTVLCATCPDDDFFNYCCDDGCRNLNDDINNCGGCGVSCFEGQTCCDGICLDIMSDEQHCGGCGNPCQAGEECVDGVCLEPDPCESCATSEACCDGACIDIMSNNDHCGDCGIECAAGWECLNGVCERLPECGFDFDCFGCDICVDGMCVDCPSTSTCCDDGTCARAGTCCPGLINCGGGLCCGGNFPNCCNHDDYCCSSGFPICCGDLSCCSSEYPVCCNDGWCCPPGCTCTGSQSCHCPDDVSVGADAPLGAMSSTGARPSGGAGITYW